MRVLLVRVGTDTTAVGGGWNAPVDGRTGLFAYVPIPEARPVRPGAQRPYSLFEDAVSGVAAGRAGGFGWVVGVDRGGNAEGLERHGADLVVTDGSFDDDTIWYRVRHIVGAATGDPMFTYASDGLAA